MGLDVRLLAARAGREDLSLDLTEEVPLPAAELGAEDDPAELLGIIADVVPYLAGGGFLLSQGEAP